MGAILHAVDKGYGHVTFGHVLSATSEIGELFATLRLDLVIVA